MLSRLRRYFLSGLIVFLPLALTVYLLFLMVNFVDGLLNLEGFLSDKIGFYIPGIGVLISVLVIVVIGFFCNEFFWKAAVSLL